MNDDMEESDENKENYGQGTSQQPQYQVYEDVSSDQPTTPKLPRRKNIAPNYPDYFEAIPQGVGFFSIFDENNLK